MKVCRPLFSMAMALAFAGVTGHAAPPQPVPPPPSLAIGAGEVDGAACRIWMEGAPVEGDAGTSVLASLGLQEGKPWSAGTPHQGKNRQYLIAFKQPVAVGSVLFQQGGTVKYLKSGAAFPPDPADTSVWVNVVFPASQSGFRLAPLPPGTETRALLCTLNKTWGQWQRLELLRLLTKRLFNAVPAAVANAEADYIAYHRLGPPTFFYANNIIRGSGSWQSHGLDQDERIPRAPVTDVDPTWFTVSWDAPETFEGLLLRSNFKSFKLLAWRGPETINPAVGGVSDWEKVKHTVKDQGDLQWISFAPVKTRGLKFLVEGTSPPKFGRIDGLSALIDLGAGPVPVRAVVAENPPYQIAVTLPEKGQFSMALDTAQGKRARNLVMREDAAAGEQTIAWDLKDELGGFVQPGTYHWKALYHPGLQLRYQMTPYPNIESTTKSNSPWLNGQSGPGGWLADHSSPRAVCAAGDRVFISAPCCESGTALIECDTDGRKYWGHGNIIAWTGPSYMAADGQSLYTAPSVGEGDYIWRFALADKKMDTMFQFSSTATRRRGIRGLAVRDGKLYLSIAASVNVLENALTASDVDLDRCEPRYTALTKSSKDDDPDPRGDFLRLFRLTGTPPGSKGLVSLETARQPAPRQHIVLSLNRPVPVGSFVFPMPAVKGLTLHLSVLKPDAPYPPVASREADWTRVWKGTGQGWTVVPAPSNTLTRAVRLSFDKGMNELDEVLAEDGGLDGMVSLAEGEKPATGKGSWNAELDGMKILRRRFENLFPSCTVTVNSGTVDANGVWDARRETPLTRDDPGVFMMTWKEPQSIRGLAIVEIDGRYADIEAWTGAGEPDMKAEKGWDKLATYEQKLRYYYQPDPNHNSAAKYMDGYVDFGREVQTRALRLRIVEQWMWKEEGRNGCVGVRRDRGGQDLDPSRCRVYGVAPLRYAGGEPEVDALASSRLEVYDIATRKLARELPLEKGGDLAFDAQGALYACSAGGVVKVDPESGKHSPLKLDVKKATALVCDKAGNLYVFDADADQRVIKVFDPAGKLLRVIGTPGGRLMGPWDPARFSRTCGNVDLGIDARDQLWVVEDSAAPKRVSLWGLDGTFKKDLLGNTPYGGGGCLDPYDKTRLFFEGQEFALDWNTGATRLKNVTWIGDSDPGEKPIKVGERLYLVTRPLFLDQPVGVVYLYEKDHLRRVAAVGQAGRFPPLRTSEVLKKLGRKALGDQSFAWSDRNGDGVPQADEVAFFELKDRRETISCFEETLAVDGGPCRYEVKEILPNGVPVYERKSKPFGENAVRTSDGGYFVIGNSSQMKGLGADGKGLWTHPNEGWGVHALYKARPWFPGQVVAQFGVVGHETAPAGDLGEFFVTHGNSGVWHLWSADGLLAGRLFRDMRGPGAKPWSMPEHERGLDLTDVTVGQEHFNGYFCRTREDDKYYAVAGHNHVSVVEVLGIDKFKRMGAAIEVTQEALDKAMEWDRKKQARQLYEAAKVIDCRQARGVTIDGNPGEWETEAARLGDDDTTFSAAYDDTYLYVCYRVRGAGPFKNTGNDWKRLFKTGASVDLQIGVDPAAKGDRKAAVAGDQRLLMTSNNGKPAAVLYQPVAPGAKPEEAWEARTMVFRAGFDRVVLAPEVKIASEPLDKEDGYCVEAAIPLKTLGLTIKPDLVVKMDWGILVSGPAGTEVLGRHYWANGQTSIVSDEAAEALLHPDLWGMLRFSTGSGKKGRPEMSLDAPLGTDASPDFELD